MEPLRLAVVGELVVPLIWLAGAKVLPKLDPGPVSADGSGSSIGSTRTVAACDGYVRHVPCVFHQTVLIDAVAYLLGADCGHWD